MIILLRSGRAIHLVALTVAAAVIWSCGDGDTGPRHQIGVLEYEPDASTTMTATEITKPQFVKRVNRICRDSWPKISETAADFREERSGLGARRAFAESVRVPLVSAIDFSIFDAIRMLGAPPGEEARIESIIRPLQASVELAQKRLRVARSEAEVEELFQVFNERARRYGLADCLVIEPNFASTRGTPAQESNP